MLKYLLLIAFALVVWWLWRAAQARKSAPPAARLPERMVTCAHCGVNQPLSESLQVGERFYCCPAHREADEASSH